MSKNKRSNETVLHFATSANVGTLRVTIPAFIVETLGLKKGDRLRWDSPVPGRVSATIIKDERTIEIKGNAPP